MRLSVDTLRNRPVTVFVCGIEQRGVVEVDTVEGWCRKLRRKNNGAWRLSGDEIEEEIVRGNVSIRWDRIAPNWRPE